MLIADVIHRYHPEWDAPYDNGRTWIQCRCPFHGDDQPSASVSLKLDAFKCHACEVKGDAIKIIQTQEGVSYAAAKRIAEEVSTGSHNTVRGESPRKPSRRVFGEQGFEDSFTGSTAGYRPVSDRLCRRAFGGT